MNYDYPLDLTGTAPSNLVRNELQVITEINGRFSQIIIPDYAPFYLDNLKVTHISVDGTETELAMDTDYFVAYPYQDLARETGKLAFGAITIVRSSAVNRFKIDYQTIGDKWAADSQHVKNQLLEAVYNPRVAYWDQLTNVQDKFPPQQHDHELTESDKWPALLAAIDRVTKAIAERDYNESSIYPTVVNYIEQLLPVKLTKKAVGLGDVENLPVASQDEVTNLVPVQKYVLLSQLLDVINRTVDGSVSTNLEQVIQSIDAITIEINQINARITQTNLAVNLRFDNVEQSVEELSILSQQQNDQLVTRLENAESVVNQANVKSNQALSKVQAMDARVSAIEQGSGGNPVVVNPTRPTPFMYFMTKS